MKPLGLTPHKQTKLLGELRQEFERLNQAHFDGRLSEPEIVISTRKTFGGYYQPRNHRIVISWQAYCEHGLAESLNTFRHEVAHIIHPHHRAEFWALASALGVTRRYASSPLTTHPPKYVYACPACGKQIRRKRRLKLSSCAACDSVFNPSYTLRLVSADVSAPASTGT